METTTYLSLGSNVGDREKNLQDAIARIGRLGQVRKVSSIYETEPVELMEQPWFLNCAVALDTTLSARDLLSALLAIEETMGRKRTVEKGPRTIDIDVLLFGDAVIESSALTVPHPEMHRRRFVLEPLAEIAADVRHPVIGKTARNLLKELPSGQVVRKI
jgi:2-amino-4-hydroxy-6-hydroxymethyldihydropteridine diphosphokinase